MNASVVHFFSGTTKIQTLLKRHHEAKDNTIKRDVTQQHKSDADNIIIQQQIQIIFSDNPIQRSERENK